MFYQNSSVSYLVKNGIKGPCKDCPGGPVIKTSPSNAGGARSIPGQGAMIPHASWPNPRKTQNRSNIVINSIKAKKMVHIKKKKFM